MPVEKILINSPSTDDHQLHLVNCKLTSKENISNTCISQYFESQLKYANNVTSTSSGTNLNVSFRGRPLNGKKVQLPDKFTFALVDKSENEKQLMASDLLNKAHYWNLDKHPSNNDPVPQVFQWLKLSHDIHSHVQLED